MIHASRLAIAGGIVALVLVAAGCGGGGGGNKAATTTSSGGGKGGTMILLANAAPSGSPDPQINYTLQEWQLLIDSHDGLVAFKRAGGVEGTKIVPDLATTVPKPTNDGKTYTFTLRKGIKFSDGTTLKPSDVKFTFERLFKVHSPNAGSWYNAIEGGDACVSNPSSCNLSKGIVINNSANTVTFHLAHGDPEFLDQLAVPFAFILPSSTPEKEVQIPPAGTGPYKWVEYNPNKQMKLVRNPYFKVWSADAQPDGNPDAIVEKFGLSVEAEVTAVENGQGDWVFDQIPADRLPELSNKYAAQVHINPLTSTYYMAFNVTIPPFNNAKARQGINYATDRNALVKIYGGPKLAQPTCQVLPPNFPGYQPYCPYTTNVGNSNPGKWQAPNMSKAQQLINQSGTKGAKVAVTTDTTDTDKAYGEYFVSLLNKLGYKATLKALSPDLLYPYQQNSKNNVQFSWSDWYQDYPAASDFIEVLLGCNSIHKNSNASPNISQYCNKNVQNQIDSALKTGITNPTAANQQWARIDHQITNDAPWVAMFNPKFVDFLSKRVSGYLFSPQWYFLVDQASVTS